MVLNKLADNGSQSCQLLSLDLITPSLQELKMA